MKEEGCGRASYLKYLPSTLDGYFLRYVPFDVLTYRFPYTISLSSSLYISSMTFSADR